MVRSAIRHKLADVKGELPNIPGSNSTELTLLGGNNLPANKRTDPTLLSGDDLPVNKRTDATLLSGNDLPNSKRTDPTLSSGNSKPNSKRTDPTLSSGNDLPDSERTELTKVNETNLPARSEKSGIELGSHSKLRPAEIAYLSSNGDISHTLLVLGADLIQRALKSRLSGGNVPPLAPYEVRMWALAKETVADWAQGRLDKHLPGDIKKDPIEYVRRVSKIYNFVVHTARHFVAKLIQDPRQIRRYFKLSAIATLIADFSTAGYKAAFEAELRTNLRARGLIIPSTRKQTFAKYFSMTAAIASIVIAADIALLVQPLPFAAGLIGMCFLSAAILRAILLVLNSIPYFSEIAEVIGHIQRQSWRLQALRMIIRIVTALIYGVLFIGFLALTGVAFAILTFGFHHSQLLFLALYVFLTLSFLIPSQIYIDGWRLKIEELPTATGEKLLAEARRDLANVSPLDSFREVLSSTEYVPTFSELLAIYGIETLLILV